MSNSIVGAKKKERKPRIAVDSAASISTAKLLYGLSEGEVYGLADGAKSIRLDGTPLVDDNGNGNFSGVRWTFAAGTNDQEHISGFPDVSNEVGVGVELKSSQPWIKAFNDTQLSAVRVRFKWDRLSETNPDNGDVNGYTIKYAIDLQTDGGAYHEIINTKIQEKTSAGYERTHRIDLPKAKTGWQLRVRRITPNSTSEYVQDTMMISAVAEVIDVKLSYPNTALLGIEYNAEIFSSVAKMSVRVKGKIIRVPDNYDPVARTYTGIWTGNFKDAYSNNPAWIFYDLCTQWRGGLGERLDATMIDRWSLYALGQYCDQPVSDGQGGLEPRFTCNVYLQKQEEAYTVLQNIAGIFRAMSFWTGERIMLDADVPQDSIYTYSAANIVGGVAGIQYSGTRNRDRHTLAKVAWDNPNNDYQTEYEYVRDEKAMSKFGVKVLDLSAFGCTSQAQAQRAGLWALKTEQLETRQVTFSVGLDGAIPTVGNIISLSDEAFAGRANGGRVSTVNSTQRIIELDREVTASVGDVLIINGGSGKSERRNISNVVGNRITVTAGFTSAEPEHVWAIETANLKLMRFRVMSITENDDATYAITGIQHEPQKYDAIDFGTDVKPTEITIINPGTVDAPASVSITSRHREVQGQTVTTLIISWSQVKGAVAYDAEWRKDDGTWVKVPRTGNVSVEINGVYSGNYMARVRAISAFDVQSRPTTSTLTAIKGKIGLPPTVVGLTATGILFGMDLKWGFVAGSGDAAFTEIQVGSAPDVNVATLAQVSYPTNTHTITGLQGNLKQSYRARLVDKLGFKSPWSAWVTGTTDANADKIMDLLQGQINEGSLNQILSTKIADIKINKDAISKETQDRIQAIIDANDRIDGVISNADVEYYLSTSATTPTGGEWLTKAPDWQQGKYMFSRTKLTEADGTIKYNPSANGVNITGAKGDKGDQGIPGRDGAKGIDGVNGIDGLEGPQGDKGIPGAKGADGKSSYTHLAYATTATGGGFSEFHFANATYIGMYVDNIETDSDVPSKYKWSLIKGADGANGVAGKAGADGRTPYFHVAYATSADGSQGFSTIVSAGKTYIGQYTDYKLEDEENDKSLYSWTKIKGEVGDTGNTGRGIESFVEQYGVSRSETDEPTTWTATVPVVTKGDYVWTRSEITYKDPHGVEHTDPIVSPAWSAISEFNTQFINYQEDTGNEFIAQGERMDGIIADYKPQYADKTQYASDSRSQQWTYWTTVAADNYASNQRITNLQSEFANSNANVTNELFTLATKDKSIAADITQLYAETGANYGLIQEVSIAISKPEGGLAAQVTELQGRATAAEVLLTDKGEIIFSYGAPPVKKEHKNNVWFKLKNEDNGTVSQTPHQWNGSAWIELKDSAALAAKADAAAAKTAAENKGEVIYSSTEPLATKRLAQNLWIDTSLVGGKPANTPKRWNGSAWVAVTDKAVVDAQAAAEAAAQAAGNKGEVIYSSTAPSVDKQKAQNLWIDTSGGKNTPKRWAVDAWLTVTDKAATDAAQAASDAMGAAQAKGEIIYSNTAPAVTKRLSQNLWIDTTNSKNTPKRWDETTGTWVVVTDKVATDAATAAAAKGEIIFSDTTPTTDKRLAQNLWIDTTTGKNTPKRWNGSVWEIVTDKVATDAASVAVDARGKLSDIAADNKLTAVEKKQTKLIVDGIKKADTDMRARAAKYNVSDTTYVTAYDALVGYIDPLLVDLNATDTISRTTFNARFNSLYGARATLDTAINTAAKNAIDAVDKKLEPANLASLVEGSGAFSDEFGSISGKFANFEAVVEGQKTAMEVISGIGNAEKLKNEIAKARLDKSVTDLNAQSVALTTQINGYTTKIADVTAKRNATADTAIKAEYNKLITDLTAARTDLTAQKAVIASQVTQLAAEKKVLDDFKEVEDGVRAQHTVKIDNDGKIVGFGLVLQKDGFSTFDVRADRFSISAPSNGVDDGKSPFMVLTTPTEIEGVTVAAGTYIRGSLLASGTITGDKIRSNTSITAPNIIGGNINIGDGNFTVNSNGNLYAESGTFKGTVLAEKISGTIDIESMKRSAWTPSYKVFYTTANWNITPSSFNREFYGSHTSYGSINTLYSDVTTIGAAMFEINLDVRNTVTVRQNVYALDDSLSIYVNGVKQGLTFSALGIYPITLPAGKCLLQFVLVNNGGGFSGLTTVGDFIDNDNIKFA